MNFLKNMDDRSRRIFWTAVLVLGALLSLTLLARVATSLWITRDTITYLDGKKKTVMELTAAATASSAAITMIPGDIGTPIADKLADLSGYTLIVLCAVFLEKYLVTIVGHAAFRILIPVSLLLLIPGIWNPEYRRFRSTSKRIISFSLVLYLLIPASVWISKTIENTYDTSIQETIDSAMESAEEIQNNAQNQNLWDRFISTIEGGINTLTSRFEGILSNFVEATAVLLVTACVIPVLVLIFMFWIVKMLFGIDRKFTMPRLPAPGGTIGA